MARKIINAGIGPNGQVPGIDSDAVRIEQNFEQLDANGAFAGAMAMLATQGVQLLFKLSGANMQAVTDQAFTKVFAGTNYVVTNVIARQRTGGASVACAGGIYTGAAKAGDALVAAGQSWVTLAAGVNVSATVAAVAGTTLESAVPNLSLTTGSTAACTADVYVYGVDIT